MKETKLISLSLLLTACFVFMTCQKESLEPSLPQPGTLRSEQTEPAPATKPASKVNTTIIPGVPATSRAAAKRAETAPKTVTASPEPGTFEPLTEEVSLVESTTPEETSQATESAPCDPCEAAVIFEPQTLHRATAQPAIITRNITMIEEADVCLTVTVENIASAWIIVDGEVVFTPSQFSQNVTTLQIVSHWEIGAHTIVMQMAGKPGGSLTIALRGCINQPPPQRLCSEVAAEHCLNTNRQVVAVYVDEGTLYCTDGRSSENNCDTCGVYGIYVWKDGAPEHYCPEDGTFQYHTLAGRVYSGHIPCACNDSLYECATWDMQDCIPD